MVIHTYSLSHLLMLYVLYLYIVFAGPADLTGQSPCFGQPSLETRRRVGGTLQVTQTQL